MFSHVSVCLSVNQGWAQGSFVEAEAEVKAERSRPRRGRLNLRQGRGEAEWNRRCLCRFDIMHNAHVVVTCSCFVDIYQWKTLQRSFIKSISNTRPSQDRGKTVWGRGEAEPVKKTASRPPRAEADASRTPSLLLSGLLKATDQIFMKFYGVMWYNSGTNPSDFERPWRKVKVIRGQKAIIVFANNYVHIRHRESRPKKLKRSLFSFLGILDMFMAIGLTVSNLKDR